MTYDMKHWLVWSQSRALEISFLQIKAEVICLLLLLMWHWCVATVSDITHHITITTTEHMHTNICSGAPWVSWDCCCYINIYYCRSISLWYKSIIWDNDIAVETMCKSQICKLSNINVLIVLHHVGSSEASVNHLGLRKCCVQTHYFS